MKVERIIALDNAFDLTHNKNAEIAYACIYFRCALAMMPFTL